MPRSTWMALGLVLLTACSSRRAAETAVKEAESAITDVHVFALRYAPDGFKAVMDEYAQARKSLAEGDYRDAVRRAERAVALAGDVNRSASAHKKQLQAVWTAVSDSVTSILNSIDLRVAELSRSPSLPQGVTREAVSAAKAAVSEMTEGLAQAANAAEEGQLQDAVHAATQVKERADKIMKSLGMGEARRA